MPTSDKVVTASNFRFWPKKRNAQIKAHRPAMGPRGLQAEKTGAQPSVHSHMCFRCGKFRAAARGGSGAIIRAICVLGGRGGVLVLWVLRGFEGKSGSFLCCWNGRFLIGEWKFSFGLVCAFVNGAWFVGFES